MWTLRSERLWGIGGVLVAALFLAAGWWLLIGPRYERADQLDRQTEQAQSRLDSLRHKLAELRKQSDNLSQYRDQLAQNRKAMPTQPALADFLREIQSAGANSGTTLTGLTIGSESSTVGENISSLSVTLTVSGQASALGNFIDQVQRVQPRAVLVTSVNAVPEGQSASFAGPVTMTILAQIFYTS